MFDYIKGKVVRKSPTEMVVEADGVGYRLLIPLSTFERLAEETEAKLFIRLYLWDNEIRLFGFSSTEERQFFELLLSVKGVGPTTALAILSGSTVADLKGMILRKDARALEGIKGVGRRLAERLVVELKDKVRELVPFEEVEDSRLKDTIGALISLGYNRTGAEKAAKEALQSLGREAEVESLIKEALKHTS